MFVQNSSVRCGKSPLRRLARPPEQYKLLPLLLVGHRNLVDKTLLLKTPVLWSQETEQSGWYWPGSSLSAGELSQYRKMHFKLQKAISAPPQLWALGAQQGPAR